MVTKHFVKYLTNDLESDSEISATDLHLQMQDFTREFNEVNGDQNFSFDIDHLQSHVKYLIKEIEELNFPKEHKNKNINEIKQTIETLHRTLCLWVDDLEIIDSNVEILLK
jgi:peptidoglycan hydrolase CwlO-like protein